MSERFENWAQPEVEEGKPTKYNWVVQHVDRFELGSKSQMGPCGLVRKGILESRGSAGHHSTKKRILTLEPSLKQIAIFGAGGFGMEVAMLVEHINEAKPTWDLIGFFDDGEPKGENRERLSGSWGHKGAERMENRYLTRFSFRCTQDQKTNSGED